MNYFFYNTDVRAIFDTPRPRFPILINNGFAAVGGNYRFGEKFEQLAINDILLMYENRRGILAIGKVKEKWNHQSYRTPLYYSTNEMTMLTDGAFEYRIAVDWFIDLSEKPIDILQVKERFGYTPRGAVKIILKQQLVAKKMIEELMFDRLPEEVAEPPQYVEGAARQILVNGYERNAKARKECINIHGVNCCICEFNFGNVYGPEADRYIHVHHLKPLSEIGCEYVVNPRDDLRPICPNCHAVLHMGGRDRTIEEVKRLVQPLISIDNVTI